jgi:hypothetical protein
MFFLFFLYSGNIPMTQVLLNTINLQAPTQLRQMKESQLHIEDLALAYADKGEFTDLPWVGRIAGSDVLVPIDGFHRLHAVEWLSSDEFAKYEDAPDVSHINLTVVKVRLTDFNNIGEAIVKAAGVNSTHGMKRKKGDIATAIAAILKVEPKMFMKDDYKLDKAMIMQTINCSATSYTRETEKLRGNLTSQRNFDMRAMNDEDMSQREIADIVGVSVGTVNTVLGVQNKPLVKTEHEENLEADGVQNKPLVKTEHSDDQEEDTTSVFTHCTAVEPVENPWGPETESEVSNVEEAPAVVSAEVTNTSASQSIITMFNTLGPTEKDELLLILSDMSSEF